MGLDKNWYNKSTEKSEDLNPHSVPTKKNKKWFWIKRTTTWIVAAMISPTILIKMLHCGKLDYEYEYEVNSTFESYFMSDDCEKLSKLAVSRRKCLSYLPTPPLGQDITQGQF